MSNVVQTDAFAKDVPLQPKLDRLGNTLEVGQVIAYEGSAGAGTSIFEIKELTEKLIIASRIDRPGKSRLPYPSKAILLPYTPDQIRYRFSVNRARWTIQHRACPDCRGGLQLAMDDEEAVGIGCNGCGAMYELDTVIPR